MSLVDLWLRDKSQLEGKSIQQVIAFAGDGRLGDGNAASDEFRTYLRGIPSELLAKYTDQCLREPFQDSGLALQDIVNEIGRRLEFSVTPGRYRGSSTQPGHDGIWTAGNRHAIVVEVKTTDAYRIDLGTIAGYRRALASSGQIALDSSSMLVVVGRQDTGDLEAQIRGSRHAWDMRVISAEALLRLLNIKEEVEDPTTVRRIHEILIPCEFTKLDPIVEIAFAAVEDIRQEPEAEEGDGDKHFTPVAFHAECIARIERKLGLSLVKQSRASFASADERTRVLCAVSRYHERSRNYWFAFHPHQEQFLEEGPKQ